jgi:hypothetical protein
MYSRKSGHHPPPARVMGMPVELFLKDFAIWFQQALFFCFL